MITRLDDPFWQFFVRTSFLTDILVSAVLPTLSMHVFFLVSGGSRCPRGTANSKPLPFSSGRALLAAGRGTRPSASTSLVRVGFLSVAACDAIKLHT